MEQVLLVVQVLIAMALIGMVLIQRSDSDGFGLGGGSGNNLMTGRGTANLLTRTTAILAAAFIINSLALSILAARGHTPTIAEAIEAQEVEAGKAPSVPLAGDKEPVKKDAAKKEDVKPEEKAAPSVPAADATEKPAAPKKAKKPVVAEDAAEMDPNAGEANE